MSEFKPSMPYNTPARIMKATWGKVNGVNTKAFADGDLIWVSAKSYLGTEKVINDKYVVVDTMVMETWFRPDIKGDDKIKLLDDGSEWEILNTPEDIDRKHQYLRFKARRCKGGA